MALCAKPVTGLLSPHVVQLSGTSTENINLGMNPSSYATKRGWRDLLWFDAFTEIWTLKVSISKRVRSCAILVEPKFRNSSPWPVPLSEPASPKTEPETEPLKVTKRFKLEIAVSVSVVQFCDLPVVFPTDQKGLYPYLDEVFPSTDTFLVSRHEDSR